MSRNPKVAIVSALGALGLIVLVLGVLAHIYPTTTGVIIAIALWVASGILRKYWQLSKGKSEEASDTAK